MMGGAVPNGYAAAKKGGGMGKGCESGSGPGDSHPVSYTHLDVYKRQVRELRLRLR